jgi:hypothetical protein
VELDVVGRAPQQRRSFPIPKGMRAGTAVFANLIPNFSEVSLLGVHWRRLMDETRTLQVLGWSIGTLVGAMFVLNAICLAMQ